MRTTQPNLECACRCARLLAGWDANREFAKVAPATREKLLRESVVPKLDVPEPEDEQVLRLNGHGLAGVNRDAYELAFRRAGGNCPQAAKLLGVSRSTFHTKAIKFGLPIKRRVAAAVSLLLATFNLQPSTLAQPVLPLPKVVPRTNPPAGQTFLLGWDVPNDSTVAGFRIYARTNGQPWRAVARVGLTNRAVVTNMFLPQQFHAVSVNAAGVESVPSNQLGLLGWDTVVEITGSDESSSDLKSWTSTPRLVACVTNPAGNQFWRNGKSSVTSRRQLRTETQ